MSDPQANALDARIALSVDNWKRKLLDLTKRNRLLNFRVNKVTTITVVDERPTEVFRHLYIAERAMRFRAVALEEAEAAEEPADDAEVAVAAVEDALEEDPALHEAEEFVPYNASAVLEHHADDWLQTTSSPEQLEHSLRRLDEQALLTIEEQGVNTLFLTLGMVHYTDADAEEVYRGPLVLLPVQLRRKNVRAGYELRSADDDPMVNPALVEYLRRMGVMLPVLPDAATISDDYDLQSLFGAVTAAIKDRKRWKVTTDVYVGLFSFQKFVMFKDLEANAQPLAAHRLTRQLIGQAGGQVVGLPDEIRALDLDVDFAPETTFQVVDADGSQLRAIAASARGHDLVIEGPPGTGKSQTITNLIAQALAAGQSVLFVAEKMAALSVVHARLVAAGLGDFCLELHSTKANKRVVMKSLAQALDASLLTVAHGTEGAERLPQVRATLDAYVHALHEPFGSLGVSPYRGYGELGRVRSATAVPLAVAIDTVTQQQLLQTVRDLEDLAVASTQVGVPAQHPWRDTTRTFYSETDLDQVGAAADDVVATTDALVQAAAAAQTAYGLPPIRSPAEVTIAVSLGRILERSPGAPVNVLQSDAWNAPPAAAIDLVQQVRALAALKARIEQWFKPEVLDDAHADDIAFIERKSSGFFSFLAFLDGRYRAVRKRWKAYRLPGYAKPMAEQAADMKVVEQARAARFALSARQAEAQQLFGGLWRGESSDDAALESYIWWVIEFRSVFMKHGLAQQAVQVAAQVKPDVTRIAQLERAALAHHTAFDTLGASVGWPADYLADAPFEESTARVRELRGALALGPRWAGFEAARQPVSSGFAAELLPRALTGALAFAACAPVFLRAFWMKWLSLVVQARPPLARFQGLTHEQRVLEFQRLDQQVLRENRAKLVQQLRDATQHRLRHEPASAGLRFLQNQMARQRGLAPLRRTMTTAGEAIRAIKPCFMMSPLTVAQLLEGAAPSFDLIIFDEASQLPTEDAIGAVIRGRQLTVVGDPKQLPPTNFFAVTTGQVQVELGEDGLPMYADSESILEEFMGAGVPMSRLKWHYRSAHESLIAFSNVSFYDADLYTFPSIDTDTAAHGLQFEYVPDGVYEGKGLNAVEARRVADEVVVFAREQIAREHAGEPPLSLGVGTFNLRQQIAIQDELELRRRADPSLEPFFDRTRNEPFFVKNLENIQGDERDVIFLSVTYGKGTDGRIRYNFGPLNGENGWRRLNVIVTRARQRMRVFSSMKGEDINPAVAGSQGPRLLREFLVFAEHGRLGGTTVGTLTDTESPFEREVCQELMSRGLRVVSQVGTSGYRIDLGVVDETMPGRFLCGIECDGVAYHAAETARDRDRLRQQVLEARGWSIHRVWSTDWFKDRPGQIERLLNAIDQDRLRVRAHDAQERARHERAAREAAAAHEQQEQARAREAAELATVLDTAGPYQRPVADAYVPATAEGRRGEILEAPESAIVQALRSVVERESPVHELEAFARVAGLWDTRLGSRIQARIGRALAAAEKAGLVKRRGAFLWSQANACVLRSRAETRMAADRIAPEEYELAIRAILAQGHSFPRAQLIAEVRAVLGFARTGRVLEEAIGVVVERMLSAGALGEGSMGVRLRSGG